MKIAVDRLRRCESELACGDVNHETLGSRQLLRVSSARRMGSMKNAFLAVLSPIAAKIPDYSDQRTLVSQIVAVEAPPISWPKCSDCEFTWLDSIGWYRIDEENSPVLLPDDIAFHSTYFYNSSKFSSHSQFFPI